jgi:predicted PurR-regulated permease PerM
MQQKNHHFLLFLVILAGIGTFFIMKPFLVSIFLAFILATMFSKSNKKLQKKLGNRKSLSSLLMCLWVMIILVIPFIVVILMTISETNQLIKNFQDQPISINLDTVKNSTLVQTLNIENLIVSNQSWEKIIENTKGISSYFFMTVKAIYNSASSFIFILVVCFFGLYYFFKDGEAILKKLMDLSPLPTNQEKEIFEKFNQMTVATIKGTLIIALIQGLLIGVVFWIAGVQAPTLWGLLTAIISIIPLLGSVLVWLPVGMVLLFLGSYWQAILVLVAGAVVVSSVDNLLRPKLIEGETSLHPLLVFLSTLGGIAVFGPLGFVIGPVVIVLLIAFLEIYRTGHVNQ